MHYCRVLPHCKFSNNVAEPLAVNEGSCNCFCVIMHCYKWSVVLQATENRQRFLFLYCPLRGNWPPNVKGIQVQPGFGYAADHREGGNKRCFCPSVFSVVRKTGFSTCQVERLSLKWVEWDIKPYHTYVFDFCSWFRCWRRMKSLLRLLWLSCERKPRSSEKKRNEALSAAFTSVYWFYLIFFCHLPAIVHMSMDIKRISVSRWWFVKAMIDCLSGWLSTSPDHCNMQQWALCWGDDGL